MCDIYLLQGTICNLISSMHTSTLCNHFLIDQLMIRRYQRVNLRIQDLFTSPNDLNSRTSSDKYATNDVEVDKDLDNA